MKKISPKTVDTKRIGFHYFPDTDHYTGNDIEQWLPILESLDVSWLILRSESTRAIPEQFIASLITRGIEPIVHLPLQLPAAPSAADLRAILRAYSSWGVKYVILFDSPNARHSWDASGWSQANLVESFLDLFIPLANECLNAGLTVIFPPLEPGGTYWDLSFLRNSLTSLQRRNQNSLLSNLHLSAYARSYGHVPDWGKGGSERWSGNKPYTTPADSQDQVGFRNFEWLQEIAQNTCSRRFPLILLGAGQESSENTAADRQEVVAAVNSLLTPDPAVEPLGMHIVSACYWLFSAAETDPTLPCAWVKPDGSLTPAAALLQKSPQKPPEAPVENIANTQKKEDKESPFPITHYLLLPAYEWGVSDWHLDVIKPFVRKHRPTIGFSIEEAALAAQVTVIGGETSFSEDTLTALRSRGCRVERISGDGTSIATKLSER